MSEPTDTANAIDAIAAHVPRAVTDWVREGLAPMPGETTQFNAAVLWVELDKLFPFDPPDDPPYSAALVQKVEAANIILADVIQSIYRFGGVIVSLDGDALTAYFPHGVDSLVTDLARRALTCALNVKYLIRAHQQTEYANTRIGLAYGLLSVFIVGEAGRWRQFVAGGTSMEWAKVCARQARRGQIVAASNIISPLSDAVVGEELISGRWLVTDLVHRAEPALSATPDGPWPREAASALRPFLAPALDAALATGDTMPAPAYQNVACMYVIFEGIDYDAPNAGRHLQEYVQRVDTVAQAHEGRLDHIRTGDRTSRLRILFDAPAPQRDRQAVACALALRRGDFAAEMGQRIGGASGYTFAGVMGNHRRRQLILTGGAVAHAAKLADQAQPGEVLVDANLQTQTREAFVFREMPPAPFARSRLEREQSATGDLDARYLHSTLPVVGRREALETIERVIQNAQAGKGQIVVFTGPAGAGKSRLAEVLVQRWFEEGGRGYGGIALSPTRYAPLKLLVDLLHDVFGLAPGDDQATKRDKLDALLRGVSMETGDTIALLGPLVGIEGPMPAHLATLDAQARQSRLFGIGIELLGRLADYIPLLLILENMQWADASTQAFLERFAPAIAEYPILLCLVGRDDRSAYVPAMPHMTTVETNRLTSAQGWMLLEQRVGSVDWPDALRVQLGPPKGEALCCLPLFAVETVRYLRDAGALVSEEDGSYTVNEAALPELPDTLEALLDARLAQLDETSRRVLQAASVAGVTFAFPVLEAVYRCLDPELPTAEILEERLDDLVEAEIILNTARQPEGFREDRFRYVAMYEAAYRSLPADRRPALHAAAAEALSQHSMAPDSVLAHHYDRAGMLEEVVYHAVEAARRAQYMYANVEAMHYYALAERNVDQMAYEGERWPLYVQISLNRGRIYLAQGEFMLANADAGRALHLTTTHRARLRQTQAFNLMAAVCDRQKRFDEAAQFAEDAVRIARVSEFEAELIEAWRLSGQAYMRLGRRQEALHRLRHALALAREYRDPALIVETAALIGVVYAGNYYMIDALDTFQEALELVRPAGDQARLAECLVHLGEVYLRRGEAEQALSTYEEAIEILRILTVRRSTSSQLGHALRGRGATLSFVGRYDEASASLDEAEAVFEAENDRHGVLMCRLVRGRALERDLGNLQAAHDHLRAVVDELSQTTEGDASIAAMLALADVHLKLEQPDEAAAMLRSARTWIELEKAHWYRPEHEMLSGHLAVARGDYETAIHHAHEALARVSGRGNSCTLPRIYLMLAEALQMTQPTDASAIHDAFDRAMRAGRGRARKLDQAVALWRLGEYLKQQDSATQRARGVGFIFEAESLFHLLGLRPV